MLCQYMQLFQLAALLTVSSVLQLGNKTWLFKNLLAIASICFKILLQKKQPHKPNQKNTTKNQLSPYYVIQINT